MFSVKLIPTGIPRVFFSYIFAAFVSCMSLLFFSTEAHAFFTFCPASGLPSSTACSTCHGLSSPSAANGSCPEAPIPEPVPTPAPEPSPEPAPTPEADEDPNDESGEEGGKPVGIETPRPEGPRGVNPPTRPLPGSGQQDFGKNRGLGSARGGKK
jgi:hypothetical protein